MHMPESARQLQIDLSYLSMVDQVAALSYAKRSKIGAMIVSEGVIISTGFNGTPRDTDNNCEYYDDAGNSHTLGHVIHAELNAILNLVKAKSAARVEGSTIYISQSPCIACAAIIKQVGIKRVVYKTPYRITEGIGFLTANGVEVSHIQ